MYSTRNVGAFDVTNPPKLQLAVGGYPFISSCLNNLERLLHGVKDGAGELVVGGIASHVGGADRTKRNTN